MKTQRIHNKSLVCFAKELRNHMTPEEKHLWYDFLRNCGTKFIRQKIIGNYIADFYCPKSKLVIELDGAQHYEQDAKEYDKKRTDFLAEYGVNVIRITNKDINENFDGVCTYIEKMLQKAIAKTEVTNGSKRRHYIL